MKSVRFTVVQRGTSSHQFNQKQDIVKFTIPVLLEAIQNGNSIEFGEFTFKINNVTQVIQLSGNYVKCELTTFHNVNVNDFKNVLKGLGLDDSEIY